MIKRALALLGLAGRDDEPDFDPAFYKAFYKDLGHLTTRANLLQHYRRHGRAEGRFPSLAKARAHFETINGPPPADFDPLSYMQRNPDLARRFVDPIQFELHFLEFGRFENRAYTSASLRPEDAWQTIFSLYDFTLFNESWLPRRPVDRDEALALFKAEGIARLAPIARDWMFDAAFYRAHYAIAEENQAELYMDWLQAGFPAGRAPNERRALVHLTGGTPYPGCFDWRRFCAAKRIDATALYPAKIEALERLFEMPVAQARAFVEGDGDRLFEMMGDHHMLCSRFAEAADAFRATGPSTRASARLHRKLANVLEALGERQEALDETTQALRLPDYSIRTLIHAVRLMLKDQMVSEAMTLVAAQDDRLRAHELFEGLVDEVVRGAYEHASDALRATLGVETSEPALDAVARSHFDGIADFVRATRWPGKPLDLPASGNPRLVLLAPRDLPRAVSYRLEQMARLLRGAGVIVEPFDLDALAAFRSALPGAVGAIFHRVPCGSALIECILYANHLGVTTYCAVDQLVPTDERPGRDDGQPAQRGVASRHAAALHRYAISLCDAALVPTRALAERIGPVVGRGSGRTFVIPDGLADRRESLPSHDARGSRGGISIFYASDPEADGRTFEIVAPALLDVMANDPRCRLVIVGQAELGRAFDAFQERTSLFPVIEDHEAYAAVLASCDINLSPLEAGTASDCKSPIGWLEAAAAGIPSIVSATRTNEAIVIHGVTGLLARDSADWSLALRSLIGDESLRRDMGAQARALAQREHGDTAVFSSLKAALLDRPGSNGTAREPQGARKTRLLICNVFFKPQSYGGATRVVQDNLDQLLARYPDAFDVSVLSTFQGLPDGELRVDSYRDCPVYRIGTPATDKAMWSPFNDDILPAFRRVLEIARPDIVHFHCIQRLTASIVRDTGRAGIPYLVTVHDAWWLSDHQFLVDQDNRAVALDEPFQTPLPADVSRQESIHRRQWLRSLLNQGAATLAVSASFADLHRAAGITNAVACENGLGALPPVTAKITPKDKIVLGHIGGRVAHKGAMLIEVVLKSNRFDNLVLLMIDALDADEEEVDLWGSTPVHLEPRVQPDHINELYSRIDVLLAPSTWPESYGLVAREALFYETWAIVGNTGAIAQDIEDGRNGTIIDTSRAEELAAVLHRIDRNVEAFKKPPESNPLRDSSKQIDAIVTAYRKALGDMSSRERT